MTISNAHEPARLNHGQLNHAVTIATAMIATAAAVVIIPAPGHRIKAVAINTMLTAPAAKNCPTSAFTLQI